MTKHYCNGSAAGVPTLECACGPSTHPTVRMHEQLCGGALCPICGLEWVPFVGWQNE